MTEGDKKPFIKLYWSLWDDKRLSGNEKLVLISLLRHYNMEKRRAWPSLNTIAEECNFSRVVVWQTLKLLEEKGFIRTEKNIGKVTRYELFLDANSFRILTGIPIQNLNRSKIHPFRILIPPIQNLNGYPLRI